MPNALRWYAKCSLQPELWTPRLCTTRFSPSAMSRSELARVCSSLGRIGGRRPARVSHSHRHPCDIAVSLVDGRSALTATVGLMTTRASRWS